MSKLTFKMETAEGMPKVRTKVRDTGAIQSVIPGMISFLRSIGYDSVEDVMIVTGRIANKPVIFGKRGRNDACENA